MFWIPAPRYLQIILYNPGWPQITLYKPQISIVHQVFIHWLRLLASKASRRSPRPTKFRSPQNPAQMMTKEKRVMLLDPSRTVHLLFLHNTHCLSSMAIWLLDSWYICLYWTCVSILIIYLYGFVNSWIRFFYSLKISTRSTTTWRSWAILCWPEQQSWTSWFPKLSQKLKASQIPEKRKGLKGPCLRTYAYTCAPGDVSIWPLTYLLSGIPGRVKNLESAVTILQAEIESVEQAKVEVSGLKGAKDSKSPGIPEPRPHSIPMRAVVSNIYVPIYMCTSS